MSAEDTTGGIPEEVRSLEKHVGLGDAVVILQNESSPHPAFLDKMSFDMLVQVLKKAPQDSLLERGVVERLVDKTEEENTLEAWLELYWVLCTNSFANHYHNQLNKCFEHIKELQDKGGFSFWYEEVYKHPRRPLNGEFYQLVSDNLLRRARSIKDWQVILDTFPESHTKEKALKKIRAINALERLGVLKEIVGFGNAVVILEKDFDDDFWSGLSFEECYEIHRKSLKESPLEERMFERMLWFAEHDDGKQGFVYWLEIYRMVKNIAIRTPSNVKDRDVLDKLTLLEDRVPLHYWYMEVYRRSGLGTDLQELAREVIYDRAEDEESRGIYELYLAWKVSSPGSSEERYFLSLLQEYSSEVDLEEICKEFKINFP